MSLSEPDVFSNFVLAALPQSIRTDSLTAQLFADCFPTGCRGQAATYSLKFRNQCVDVIDLYYEAFPQAKHLFLYRNALDWVASIYRMSIRRNRHWLMSWDETLAQQAAFYNRELSAVEPFFDPTLATYTWETYRATGWLLMMDRYLELFPAGIHPLALRYEDLIAQPERVLSAIFESCDLPKRVLFRRSGLLSGTRRKIQSWHGTATSGNTCQTPR